MFVAKAARKAAQHARSELKATIARQELSLAIEKNKQLAIHARKGTWVAVRIHAEEIMNSCQHISTRWQDDTAFKKAHEDLQLVANKMQSIISEVDQRTSKTSSNVLNLQAEASKSLSGITGLIDKNFRSQDQ